MAKISGIVTGDGLIEEEAWNEKIRDLTATRGPQIHGMEHILPRLVPLIEKAIVKRMPKERFGVLLSGGVDSSLISFICKRHAGNFTCYSVGTGDSEDIKASKEFTKMYGISHVTGIYSQDEMKVLFDRTRKILGDKADALSVGVGAVELSCIDLARNDGIRTLFGGLGSEEIFAGYQRHDEAEDINEECIRGLHAMWRRDLVRDHLIAKSQDAIFLTPYLDDDLIRFALSIPGELKIKDDIKKYILREAALKMGLDRRFAFRPKKAAQYGSNFHKALSRAARKEGHKYIKDFLSCHEEEDYHDDKKHKKD